MKRLNSHERAAHDVAKTESNKVWESLRAAGVSDAEAADSASRVYDQEYRHELAESYGEDLSQLREDLELLADCLTNFEGEDEAA